jgi:hypothetical protein
VLTGVLQREAAMQEQDGVGDTLSTALPVMVKMDVETLAAVLSTDGGKRVRLRAVWTQQPETCD